MELVVLAGEAAAPEQTAAAVWDRLDVPAGRISVPGVLHERLPAIRAELLTWVYELGRLPVPGGSVQERLKAGDSLSQWWCSLLFEKHPKVTPDLWPALKLRALEHIIAEGGYDALALAGDDPRLETALRDFCARTGRPFRVLRPHGDPVRRLRAALRRRIPDPRPKAVLRALYHALPGPCKALGRLLHWLWRVRRVLPRTDAPRPAGPTATIATYFPNIDPTAAEQGRFRSRYWESLHDALTPPPGQRHRVNWLFIAFPSPQYSFARCLALRDAFRATGLDGASFHYLEEFLTTGDLLAACRRYVRLAVTGARLERAVRPHFRLPGSAMNLWPFLGPYWKDSFGGWRCLERCLQRRAFLRYADWSGPQDWTIFPMENCPWERMLTEAVHRAGNGPVHGTQHSTVRPTDFRYFDDPRTFSDPETRLFQPDTLHGNGRGACAAMAAAGTPAERLGMVEALRYLYLAGKTARPAPVARRLLVVTSFFADEVDDHLRLLCEAARAGLLAGWQVVVKPHPYLAVEERLRRRWPGPLPEISSAPIGRMLVPGTAVWASNSTTVSLEAALLGLAVLVQMPVDDVDLCPLQDVPGVARCAALPQAAAFLEDPRPVSVPHDYLALDPALPRWKHLLRI